MPPPDPSADQARAAIQAALGQIGFALPGTITIRHARCGKPRCACAADPPALHGPYIQWTRTVNGKTVTRLLSPAQYQAYAPWFGNARRLRALTAELQALSLTGNGQGRRLGHDHPGHARPRPAPSSPGSRTTPKHPKHREISPLNPGTAHRQRHITPGQRVLSLARVAKPLAAALAGHRQAPASRHRPYAYPYSYRDASQL